MWLVNYIPKVYWFLYCNFGALLSKAIFFKVLWESSDWWLRLDAVYFEEQLCCCSSKLDELLVTNPARSFRQIRKQNNCKSAQPTLPPGIRFSFSKETIWQHKWERNYFCNNFWTILFSFTLIDSSLVFLEFHIVVSIKPHLVVFEIVLETEFLKWSQNIDFIVTRDIWHYEKKNCRSSPG